MPGFRSLIRTTLVFILFAHALPACDMYGDGDGEVKGLVCLGDDATECKNYDMEPGFFSLTRADKKALIEIRDFEGDEQETDHLIFEVTDHAALRSWLNQTLHLSSQGLVRPQIHLVESFGFDHQPVDVDENDSDSVITFERYGSENGDRVKAQFSLELIGRLDGRWRGRLSGWFSFKVRSSRHENGQEIGNW